MYDNNINIWYSIKAQKNKIKDIIILSIIIFLIIFILHCVREKAN